MPKAVIKDGLSPEEPETRDVEDEIIEKLEEPLVIEETPEEEETAEQDDAEADSVPLESLDPEEELWEGGPTVAQALEWKSQYGRLYITSLDYDDHILWRPLLRSEYKEHVRHIEKLTNSGQVSQLDAKLLNEEMLTETCMLWPRYDKAVDNIAGLPALISEEIMEASGFVALQVRQI